MADSTQNNDNVIDFTRARLLKLIADALENQWEGEYHMLNQIFDRYARGMCVVYFVDGWPQVHEINGDIWGFIDEKDE